jgi:hypothetical protein
VGHSNGAYSRARHSKLRHECGVSSYMSCDECGALRSRVAKLGAGNGVLLSFQACGRDRTVVPRADGNSSKGLGGRAGSSDGGESAL